MVRKGGIVEITEEELEVEAERQRKEEEAAEEAERQRK